MLLLATNMWHLIPHLCSWAATCTESMIWRRASEISLALTVCCSNFVFTADWEMHSYKSKTMSFIWSAQKRKKLTVEASGAAEHILRNVAQSSETRTFSLESLQPAHHLQCSKNEPRVNKVLNQFHTVINFT